MEAVDRSKKWNSTAAAATELFYSAPPSPSSHNDDFEFNFSDKMLLPSLSSADELFHAGKIRPLIKPPPLQPPIEDDHDRGRSKSPRPKTSRKGVTSRSVSPLRVSEFALLQSEYQSNMTTGKKWRLKDLLLFRSASDGRASSIKDPLKKYYQGSCSFRSTHEDLGSAHQYRNKLKHHAPLLACFGFNSPIHNIFGSSTN